MDCEGCRPDKRCHYSSGVPHIYELASSCSIYIKLVEVPEDPQPQAESVGASLEDNSMEVEREDGWMSIVHSFIAHRRYVV